jgi:HK97 gp10 family phage protein
MAESFNHFDEIAGKLDDALSKVVTKTALTIQRAAAKNAPVDTGFLRNSIYTVTASESTYVKRSASAKRKKKKKKGSASSGAEMLPAVAAPSDKNTAFVAVGANYGAFVELGTARTPAQPYFYPAIDNAKPAFERALNAVKIDLGVDS